MAQTEFPIKQECVFNLMAKSGNLKTGDKLTGYTFFSLKKDFGKAGYPYRTFRSLPKAKKAGYNTSKLNWVKRTGSIKSLRL